MQGEISDDKDFDRASVMRCIICGTMVREEYEDKIPQLSNAGNRFLLNFTNEIKKKHSVKILSYIGVDVPVEIREKLEKENLSDSDIHYYFKSRFKARGVAAYWHAVRENLKQAECLIAYNPMYAYLNAPFAARRHKKKSALILADYSPKETCAGKMQQLYAALQLKSIRNYDVVIGLSENVKGYLTARQKFIHMSGGIDRFVYDYFGQKNESLKSDKVIFMYAGTLEKVTGIDMLLEAFGQTEADHAELWISGKGSMASLVERFGRRDARIRYLGCPPYRDYLGNLKRATVLVNPRNMNLPENENNFPSKILEYLATGKPIVSTKFSGWNKYEGYISFCESNTGDLAKKISDCLRTDRIEVSYEKNRDFAYSFLWEVQMKKVIEEITARSIGDEEEM